MLGARYIFAFRGCSACRNGTDLKKLVQLSLELLIIAFSGSCPAILEKLSWGKISGVKRMSIGLVLGHPVNLTNCFDFKVRSVARFCHCDNAPTPRLTRSDIAIGEVFIARDNGATLRVLQQSCRLWRPTAEGVEVGGIKRAIFRRSEISRIQLATDTCDNYK